MNKNKITSMILISTMLSQTMPVANAQEVVTTDISLEVNTTDVENIDTNTNDNESSSSTEDVNTSESDILVEGSIVEAETDLEITNDSNLSTESMENTESVENIIQDDISDEHNAIDTDIADYNDAVINENTEDVITDSNDIEIQNNENIKTVDSAIVKNNVYEITLSDGQFVPDLSAVPSTCDTIVVITTGNKKLVVEDYAKLNASNKPHIDLSQSKSDSIPNVAFGRNSVLESFKFPQGVTEIGNGAFNNCTNWSELLVIPDTVTKIGNGAFSTCVNLKGPVLIPNALTDLGNLPFENCISIDKFIIKTDDSYSNRNYRIDIAQGLKFYNVLFEIPSDFDASRLPIPTNILRPIVNIEKTTPDGLHSLSTSLYIPNTYSENDLIVLKDGERYQLPSKDSNGKYIFDEDGEYSIELTTLLDTTYDFNFSVASLINKPTISFQNNAISIIDNGNLLGVSRDRVEYRINNSNWETYTNSFRIPDEFVNGVDDIKIEARVIVGSEVSKISEISVNIKKATIEVENITITQGDEFNALDYVKAIDVDDRDISKKVTIVKNDVKIETPGDYTVIYKVEANNGYSTEKEIKVTVLKKKLPPIINANNITLNQGSEFNPLDFVTASDDEGNLIDKSKIEILENTVNTAKPGTYIVTYKIIDNEGHIITKTIDVVVKIASNNNNNSNSNNSNNNNSNSNSNSNSNNYQDKLPNAGGYASSIYLMGIVSLIGGVFSIKKKNK